MSESFHTVQESHIESAASDAAPSLLPASPVLGEMIKQGVTHYLEKLEGTPSIGLYDLVVETVEEPLLQIVMRHTSSNQVQAAKLLGIARGTLRTRSKKYGMID